MIKGISSMKDALKSEDEAANGGGLQDCQSAASCHLAVSAGVRAHPLAIRMFSGLPMMVMQHARLGRTIAGR
jgi:hypothetical protein